MQIVSFDELPEIETIDMPHELPDNYRRYKLVSALEIVKLISTFAEIDASLLMLEHKNKPAIWVMELKEQ